MIPEPENEVSLLGEKLTVDRPEGSATYASPGRPIAVVSNMVIENASPALPPKPPPLRRPGHVSQTHNLQSTIYKSEPS